MMRSFLHNFYLQENDKVIDALKLMVSKNVGFVSILEENKLVGILTVDDIAKYLADKKVI
jgi:CBS domain-containing protein